MKQKTLFNISRIFFGLLILAVVFFKIGFKEIFGVLLKANMLYYSLAFLFFMISVVLAAINIKIILIPFKDIKFVRIFNYFLISNRVASLFMPGRIGEYSIIFLLKKDGLPMGISAAAITMDKIITLLSSAIIAFIGLLYFFNADIAFKAIITISILFAALIIALMPVPRRLIKKHILRKYADKLSGFSSSLISYCKSHKSALALNLVITLLRSVVIAASAFLMFSALGASPNIFAIIAIGGIETISTILPITISGLGVKQSIGIYLYHLLGISASITAARYVLGFVINYGFALISLILIRNPAEKK